MKVCTDACIFGSWIAHQGLAAKNCLDIGAGTGLLSLMYAQKNFTTKIDAVEIEENAYLQAKENFSNIEWNDHLQVFNWDIKNFSSKEKYDLIISNPPFYENDLRSEVRNKNLAKHDTGLSFDDLILSIKNHLKDDGHFSVLLPYHRIKQFETIAEQNNFFLKEKLLIRQTPSYNFFRGALLFNKDKNDLKVEELTIKNNDGSYTADFVDLLKDYYLHL